MLFPDLGWVVLVWVFGLYAGCWALVCGFGGVCVGGLLLGSGCLCWWVTVWFRCWLIWCCDFPDLVLTVGCLGGLLWILWCDWLLAWTWECDD